MKKQLIALSLCASFSSLALAEDYQFDVAGSISRLNSDAAGADDTILGAGIQYHFKAVDTSKGPLAEAAFLTRSSNVSALQFYSNETDEDATTLAAEVYIPNTMFYAAVAHTIWDSNDTTTFNFGLTPLDGLLVTTSYNDDVDYDPNINAKYLMPLDGDNSLVLRGGLVIGDDDEAFTAGADYYLNRYTGVGFNITDSYGDTTTELHVEHFFLDDAYAGISYAMGENDDLVTVHAGFRF